MTNNKFQIKSKFQITIVVVWVLVLGISAPAAVLAQGGAVDPAFNPNFLIPDEAFEDAGTFGTIAAVQTFLEQRGSVLANTNQDFLLKLKEPDTLTKVALEDPEPNLERLRTAAELIFDAAHKTGLNTQVLLVILQKEQGLITNSFGSNDDLQRALDRGLGFGCPDYEGCGDIFLGFYRQLFGTFDANGNRWLGAAASLMRSFRAEVNGVRAGRGPMVDLQNQTFGRPVVRTTRKGDTVIIDNTLGGYDGVPQMQTVIFSNLATAALYRYTPHVFNGNYNFWKFYTLWFKYPNGTIIQKVGDAALYVIDNGSKRLFSTFVASQRKLKTTNIVPVSQIEFDSYITEKPLPPLDNTLIKGDANAAVYLVSETKKRPVSYAVFIQRKLSFANIITLPQAEVDGYEQGGYWPPVDGTLIKGEQDLTVYLIESGLKRPISYEVFVARKLSFKKLMKLTDAEVAGIGSGQFVLPPDKVVIVAKADGSLYWYSQNQKQPVSAFVFKQRGLAAFPKISLGPEEVNAIPVVTPLVPRDGTIIKGDASTAIYKMENSLKRLFTPKSYKRLGYPRANILPQAEVDSYNVGTNITK